MTTMLRKLKTFHTYQGPFTSQYMYFQITAGLKTLCKNSKSLNSISVQLPTMAEPDKD